MKPLVFLLAVLLCLPTAFAKGPKSKTIPIHGKFFGSLIHAGDQGLFDGVMKGKLGTSTGRGTGVTVPVTYDELPTDNLCVDLGLDGNGDPVLSGALIVAAQAVFSFKDGSMIWLDTAPDAYVCFVPGFAYAPYEIKGGYKRFEGASGWITFEIETYSILPPPDMNLVVPETGIATGEIVLP